jgi:regulator of RNase E activity RraA
LSNGDRGLVEPWHVTETPVIARPVPADLLTRFASEPDIVEELSDRLGTHFRLRSSVDFSSYALRPRTPRHVGPIVTVRYAPKLIPDNEQRLGHDRIARALPSDAIVVVEASECEGSVIGGAAAETLRAAHAAAVIVNGFVRDLTEVEGTGLTLVGRRLGIQSGRPFTQLCEIGGQISFERRLISNGDVGVLNKFGLVCIPAFIDWDDLRAAL